MYIGIIINTFVLILYRTLELFPKVLSAVAAKDVIPMPGGTLMIIVKHILLTSNEITYHTSLSRKITFNCGDVILEE